MKLTDQQRAEKSAQCMWERDDASRWLGLSLDSIGPGTARLSMTVEKHHMNGHRICHGGFMFTLADSAFAFACNSYNKLAVAQHNTVTFVAPGKLGDVLTAEAREVVRYGRSGIYDVRVVNQDEKLIAEFRGNSRVLEGTHFEEDDG